MKTAALIFCKWSIALAALPVLAAPTEDAIPLKNGRQVSLMELRVDIQKCSREAAAKHPSTTFEDQLPGEQRRLDATRAFSQAVGADISSDNELLTSLGNRLRQQIEVAQQARERIAKKQRINMVDNPAAWLHGQLTIEEDGRILNGAMRDIDETTQLISKLTDATQAVSRINTALAQRAPYPSSQKLDGADDTDQQQYLHQCMLALGYARDRVQKSAPRDPNEPSEYATGLAGRECQVNSDCTNGKSCRSRSGGGTECR